jgi:cyclopropane-fatty-acyl-phospholipid synthase
MGFDGETAQVAEQTTRVLDRARAARVVRLPDRWLADRVQRMIEPAAVRLELWDGSSSYAGSREPVGDILVADRRTLWRLAVNPDLWFGESYMAGRLEVRGGLEPVVETLTANVAVPTSWLQQLKALLTRSNSLALARRNVHHHYDLGNSFYQLWLDRELVYTCAYFADPEMSLEDAQVAKLDLVCRKLRLRPGESVVEAGCGWGALAMHMARHYGVKVKAFNVSREQLRYARERASRDGLSGLVEFIDDDYRNVSGEFDVFVSVGMLEHVGVQHYQSLAEVLRRCLKRTGGRGLLHFIGRDVPRPLNAWISRRIFPGAYPPTLAEVARQILEPGGMSVIDVENLRLHYRETLAHWSQRFAAAREQVRTSYGEAFRRAWELYLAGSQAAFATGYMQLFQVVFVPRESPPPSWTRADMYEAQFRPHPAGAD